MFNIAYASTYRLLVICLDLDIGIRAEVGHNHILQLAQVNRLVFSWRLDVEVESVQVRSRDDKVEMSLVGGIKLECIWRTLGSRPEWHSR